MKQRVPAGATAPSPSAAQQPDLWRGPRGDRGRGGTGGARGAGHGPAGAPRRAVAPAAGLDGVRLREVAHPDHLAPGGLLEGAHSLICVFLPFRPAVISAARRARPAASGLMEGLECGTMFSVVVGPHAVDDMLYLLVGEVREHGQ